MWVRYQPNPCGRNVGDCAVRAISKALGMDWETAYAMIVKAGFLMNDMPSSNSVWGSVLRTNGFYRHVIPNSCPDCYSINDFAEDHPKGVFVVCTGNHVVTIKDGFIMDSWDSSNEIVQFYWSRKDES
jgi:hypothetical protein